MRNYTALIFVLCLAACGGGSASSGGATSPTGSTIPVGSVSGITFDGLILNGTVRVYDFTTGAKGALLGQTVSDSSNGLYNLSLQVESRPVLIEITGGYYVEEAQVNGSSVQVSLGSNLSLTALANYTTGSALKTAVTTYSHLAAGLAAYQIAHGTSVATAIDNANIRVSSLAGVDILTTTPKEITDISNASATLTPELKYGFLAGAISTWALKHTPISAPKLTHPYTSIDFAQLLYQDISADGLLDGIGLDSTGAAVPLSFGTTPLGSDIYRLGIGTAIVQMAGDTNNHTGLTGVQVLSFAQSYISNTDAFFNNVAPSSFAPPTAAITSPATNAWARKTISVVPSVTSPFGLDKVELVVDGAVVATSAGAEPISFQFDTTVFADGAHAVQVRATDLGGFVATATIQSKIDNTPPTLTGSYQIYRCSIGYSVPPCQQTASESGSVEDKYSGVVGVVRTSNGQVATLGGGGSWSYPPLTTPNGYSGYVFRVTDAAGNCSDYSAPAPASVYVNTGGLTMLTAGACP